MANELLSLSTTILMDRIGDPGSRDSHRVLAELQRRQTEAQISAAQWMQWSVVALALTTIINTAIQVWLQISN